MRVLLMAICLFAILYSCKKEENGTTTVIPLSPTDLTGTVVSSSKIKLDWLDKSTNEDGFNIERKTTATSFAQIAKMGKDITSFTDSNLLTGTTYIYRVSAFNSAGASITYTNEVNLSTYALPSITTISISDTMAKTATSGGMITSDGGSAIITKGIVWSTAANPTISLTTKTTDGSGNSSFASKISGLTANTKYYIRAYATNSAGTAYGNELSFTTNTIDLNSGLVAYYPFSGNAGDSSGNGNHGIVNGASLTTDRFMLMNQAYKFDGINNHIKINPSLQLTTISGALSICAWIKNDGIGKVSYSNLDLQGIFGPATYLINDGGFFLRLYDDVYDINNNRKYNFGISLPAYEALSSQVIVPVNDWQFVTATFDGANMKIYINGVLDAIQNKGNSLTQSFNVINRYYTIGQCIDWQSTNTVQSFNGSIDEIRIYNRALTQPEITYLTTH